MKNKEKKTTILIYIDENKKKKLKEEADKLDIPLNSLIKMRLFKDDKEVKDGS